jgi:succinate dehydrogenase / fumarate reductase iron-sulfur subunit
MQAGGFVEQRVGSAQDANALPISKEVADKAMDAAACIGCGACVAVCPNASAMLFTSAKVSQLNMLPQGKSGEGSPLAPDGPGDGCRRVRELHQHRRM